MKISLPTVVSTRFPLTRTLIGWCMPIRSLSKAAIASVGLEKTALYFVCGAETDLGEIVATENDVLWVHHYNRFAVCRLEQILRRQHQQPRLDLGLEGKRNVYRHLVAIEIGVEGSANQWMQLDGFAFDENRLECLDTEAVKRRGTIQEDAVILDDLLENVPDFRPFPLHQLLCAFDCLDQTFLLELSNHEWLEKLQGHPFGKSALVQLELWSHNDHGTA